MKIFIFGNKKSTLQIASYSTFMQYFYDILIFWWISIFECFSEIRYLKRVFFILYFLWCRLDHKPDSWDLREVCVSVGDSWFISPLYLFTAMVHAGEQSLLEYDFKTSVSVDLEESDGGWEIIILEARIEDCLINSKVQKMKPKKEPHFIISSPQGPFLGLSRLLTAESGKWWHYKARQARASGEILNYLLSH